MEGEGLVHKPNTMLPGKIYGGLKVVQADHVTDYITVECLRCGEIVERNRSNVRSGRLKSCGRFSCKARSNPNSIGVKYELQD